MTPTNGTPGNGSNGNSVPRPRADWIANRKAKNTDGNFSQMRYARNGIVTEEMVAAGGQVFVDPKQRTLYAFSGDIKEDKVT